MPRLTEKQKQAVIVLENLRTAIVKIELNGLTIKDFYEVTIFDRTDDDDLFLFNLLLQIIAEGGS